MQFLEMKFYLVQLECESITVSNISMGVEKLKVIDVMCCGRCYNFRPFLLSLNLTVATWQNCLPDFSSRRHQVDEAMIMQRTGHRSVNGVHAYKRESEKISQLTTSVLNRNEKKAKVEEGMKTEGVRRYSLLSW